MKQYMYIGLGGFLGALSRYVLKAFYAKHFVNLLPWDTLFINITGSFIMSLVLTIAFTVWPFDPNFKNALTIGFIGAYTTFSTFCKESVKLLATDHYFSALSYVGLSLFLGFVGIYLGYLLGQLVLLRLLSKNVDLYGESNKWIIL